MRFKLSAILLCFILLSANLVNSYNTNPITAENVAQLSQISSIESPYLGEKAWSGDGNWLAVGTSHDGVQVFTARDLSIPPIQIAGGLDVLFHPNNQALASAGAVWDIATQQALLTYGAVDYKIFSPDGQYLITAIRGAEQTNFAVYELSTYTEIYTFDFQTPVSFYRLVFSEDSSRFALLFQNTNPRIEANSFVQVRETATGNMQTGFDLPLPIAKHLIFSNAGQYFTVFTYEESYQPIPTKLVIWDIAAQSPAREFELDTYDPVLSPDGNWFFIQDFSTPYLINLNTLVATNLNTGGEDVDTTSGGINPEFSPDGRYIAQAYSEFMGDYYEYGVLVWEMTDVLEGSLTSIAKVHIESSNENHTAFEFSSDSQSIVLSYSTETFVWDIATESIIETIPATGSISFIPESPYIRIGNSLWDSEAKTLTTHSGTYSAGISPITSPDERLIATQQPDSLNIFNRITGEETNLLIFDDYLGRAEALNAEAGIAVFKDKSLTVYDLNNQEAVLVLNPSPFSFRLSDDGTILIAFYQSRSNTNEYAATIYHLREDRDPLTLNTILPYTFALDLAFSPDNQYLFVAQSNYQDTDNRMVIYDLATGAELTSWSEDSVSVYGVHTLFSPDNQYILTMATERSSKGDELLIKIWELSALLNDETQARTTLGIASGFVYDYDMSFNQLDNQLVVMTDDASLGDGPAVHHYILGFFHWDSILTHTGNIMPSELNPVGLFGAHSPAFNPNSSLLLTRGTGWSIDFGQSIEYLVLWDMENTSEPVQALEGYIGGELNPDATLLAGLSQNAQVVLWDTANILDENPSPIFSMDIPDAQALDFSPDGSLLYVRTTYSLLILGIPE